MAESTTVEINANAHGFLDGLKDAEKALEGFFKSLATGSFSEIAEGIGGLVSAAGPLAAVAAAGLAVHEAFKLVSESVAEAEKWNIEADRFSRQLGITAGDASVLNEALKVQGVESESYTRAVNFMTRALINGSVGFKNLGIETRNNDGTFRNSQEIMSEAIEKLNALPDSTEKNIIGQQLFGRAWLTSREILRVTGEVLAETNKHMTELGTKATPESIKTARDFHVAMAELHATFEAFLINLGNKLMPTLTDFAKWLSGVGTEGVKLFREGLDDLGVAFDYVKNLLTPYYQTLSDLFTDIAETFRPILKDLGDALVAVFGPSNLDLLGGINIAIKTVVATMMTLVAIVQILWDVAVGAFTYIKDGLFSIGVAAKQAIEGNYGEAIDTLKAGDAVLAEDADKTASKISATWERLNKRVEDLVKDRHANSLGPMFGPEEAPAKPGNVDTGKDKSGEMVKAWKDALNEIKLDEANWFSWSNEQELAFWQEKLGQTKKGTAAYHEVLSEIAKLNKTIRKEETDAAQNAIKTEIDDEKRGYDEKLADLKAASAKRMAAQKEGFDEEKTLREARVAIAKDTETDPRKVADLELQAIRDEMSAEERLQAQTSALRKADLAEAKTALDIRQSETEASFLEMRRAAGEDFAAQQKIDQDELKAHQEILKERAKLDRDEDIAEEKDRLASSKRKVDLEVAAEKNIAQKRKELTKEVEGYLQPFVKGFSDGIKKMLDGTLSFGDAIKGLGSMLVNAFGDMISQMVTVWLEGLAKMLAQWIANLFVQEATKKTSDATAAATGAATRVSEAEGYAGVGAAAAAASVAAIPFVGWAMVPEVFGSTLALLQSAVPIAAAAGGFDVPAGLNPVTQLHAEEMVLPAPLADRIRSLTDAGGAGGGGGGGSVSVNISAVDGHSVARLFRDHDSTIVKALARYARDGKMPR